SLAATCFGRRPPTFNSSRRPLIEPTSAFAPHRSKLLYPAERGPSWTPAHHWTSSLCWAPNQPKM
ncbi:unnamed protein product, partial [Pylaiella littoralis]